MILRGKANVFGDYIDAYQILPKQHWERGTKIGSLNAQELKTCTMEGGRPGPCCESTGRKILHYCRMY